MIIIIYKTRYCLESGGKLFEIDVYPFWNDKAILAISIFAAIIIWAAVCVSFAPETTNIIKDVPVVLSTENDVPSQCNLQVFGDKEFTVDITVSGSRYVIGENLLSADDFEVAAVTSNVIKAGTYGLQLKVRKVNEDADYKIAGVSKDSINVYYDAFDKKEVPVTVSVNKTDAVVLTAICPYLLPATIVGFALPRYSTDMYFLITDFETGETLVSAHDSQISAMSEAYVNSFMYEKLYKFVKGK